MNPDEVVRALRICAGGHCTEQDKENTCPWSCGDETCLTEQQNDAATLIETLLAENAELKEAQRWVPVGERLPERYEPVLIYNPMWVYPVMSMLRDDDEFWTGSQVVTPTHWQPLPAAPKGE